jgi:hypothetical protein
MPIAGLRPCPYGPVPAPNQGREPLEFDTDMTPKAVAATSRGKSIIQTFRALAGAKALR